MILYVNGCSHTAAAEAVVSACFAEDDGRHGIDRRPHPVNLAASWGAHLASALGADLVCEAESAGSNARIIRTTTEWIEQNPHLVPDTFFILQWTTWEREEWLHQGTWYQVNASGLDWVPESLRDRYRQFIIDLDYKKVTVDSHNQIWAFKQLMDAKNCRYLFFNGHSAFSDIHDRQDWGIRYIDPYGRNSSYHNWLLNNGGQYANPKSYHFDAKSHRLWANYVLQYLYCNQLVDCNSEVPTD
jgi:hypothetical protein